jgi:hypothetical protein
MSATALAGPLVTATTVPPLDRLRLPTRTEDGVPQCLAVSAQSGLIRMPVQPPTYTSGYGSLAGLPLMMYGVTSSVSAAAAALAATTDPAARPAAASSDRAIFRVLFTGAPRHCGGVGWAAVGGGRPGRQVPATVFSIQLRMAGAVVSV